MSSYSDEINSVVITTTVHLNYVYSKMRICVIEKENHFPLISLSFFPFHIKQTF